MGVIYQVRAFEGNTKAEASTYSGGRVQLAATRTPFAFRLAHLKFDFRQIAKAAHAFVGEVKAALGQINTHKLWAEKRSGSTRPPSSLIPSRF